MEVAGIPLAVGMSVLSGIVSGIVIVVSMRADIGWLKVLLEKVNARLERHLEDHSTGKV